MPDWSVFWSKYGFPLALVLGQSVLTLVAVLLIVAYLLLADRKIWAAVQLRRGPNVVGAFGLLQSFADFLKFVLKEPIIPGGADKTVFLLAPLITSVLALSAWAVIPVAEGWVVADLNVGILYLFAISSLGVYGVIMGGWASNSKYPFLGALRSAAQMVSYEVSIGFVIVTVLLCAGSLNLTEIVNAQRGPYGIFNWYWLPLFPMFVIFFVSALAETNRPPFDLPEAESELVAGFMTEYSSTPYLLFQLGEYVSIVVMCALTTILFSGRMAAASRYRAPELGPGGHLVHPQGLPRFLYVLYRESHRAALPLRPAYAAGMEGVPAVFAVHGRRGGDGAAIWWRSVMKRAIQRSNS